ncbi:MAG: hypothetical protein NT062_25180 [Proteobacteria bacterium]|nr:hypothetical protein [Pseudomonadota bacterium]
MKIRTRAVAAGSADGSRNAVSVRLNCRASACISASARPVASSNTHSGLPENGSPAIANTLTSR